MLRKPKPLQKDQNCFCASMRRARAAVAEHAAESRDPSIASASSVATPQPSCDVDETLFRYQLIDRLASGKMWPADVAELAWSAMKVGAKGVDDLAVNPASKGMNAARRVRTALGLDLVEHEVLFQTQVPLWDVYEGDRRVRPLLIMLPHEAIARDYLLNKESTNQDNADQEHIR